MPLNSEEINFENRMTSCFLGIIIRSRLYALLTKRGVKMAKEELGLYPAILTVRLVNKIFLIQQKDFPLMRIRNNFLFRRPGKKASCVCSTINPRRSFTLFFSTVFCRLWQLRCWHCPKVANFVIPLHALFLSRGIKAGNPERARWAYLACSGSQ